MSDDEFGDVRDELIIEDGRAHCPRDDCDWWVPEGMGYGYFRHREREHGGDER